MPQPTPDELQVAYEALNQASPQATTDTSHDDETIYNILKALPEASTYHQLLEKHPDLVRLLSGTENGEYTLLLPVNAAWDSAPGLAEQVGSSADPGVLSLHISDHFLSDVYSRSMTNFPSIYEPDSSNGPQVIALGLDEKGRKVGEKGRFVRPSMRASNGIVYFIDQVMTPPKYLVEVLYAKGNYSALIHAIKVSGFAEDPAAQASKGGTLFAPNDVAFASLGPEALQFLTETDEGKSYLNVLLKLHFTPDITLFSNFWWPKNNNVGRRTSADAVRDLRGQQTLNFPTLAKTGDDAPKVDISITRHNCLITLAVNSTPVVEQDIAGIDGTAQGINEVLLPGGVVGKGAQDVVEKIKTALGPFM